jgi:hypothetical protein
VAVKIEPAQTVLGKKSGDHHKPEHHRQEQVKEIVAGVDGCYTDAHGEEQEAETFGGQTDRPAGGQIA